MSDVIILFRLLMFRLHVIILFRLLMFRLHVFILFHHMKNVYKIDQFSPSIFSITVILSIKIQFDFI